jgi:hypothetical protein
MEIHDRNEDRRDELAWTAIRGAADVAATVCAAHGRHDWAITIMCLLAEGEVLRAIARWRW